MLELFEKPYSTSAFLSGEVEVHEIIKINSIPVERVVLDGRKGRFAFPATEQIANSSIKIIEAFQIETPLLWSFSKDCLCQCVEIHLSNSTIGRLCDLGFCNNLRSLALGNCFLDDLTTEWIGMQSHLLTLYLSGPSIDDRVAGLACSGSRNSLSAIILLDSRVELLETFGVISFPFVRTLLLDRSKVSDQSVANILRLFPELDAISLGSTSVSYDAAFAIRDSLKKLRSFCSDFKDLNFNRIPFLEKKSTANEG